MTPSATPAPSPRELALYTTILHLQARVDSLTTLVETLALHAGSSRQQFRETRRTSCAAFLQKRLDLLEDQDPRLAALLDTRSDASALDLDLLDHLRSDEEGVE